MNHKHFKLIFRLAFLVWCLLNQAVAGQPPIGQPTALYKVVGIIDGDTIDVIDGERRQNRVRLSQIDAPESSQDFGKRSRQALSAICFGKHARLIQEGEDRRYRRLVARVYCDGVDAQSHMVSVGMAWVYDRYVTDKSLYAIQEQAKAAKRGLWSDARAVPPWTYRRQSK